MNALAIWRPRVNEIYCMDVLQYLWQIADNTVHCVVTSPPYYGLRDYGVTGQIGLEETPDEYLKRMVAVFREVRRVLCPDGTCWVNMGDSFASDSKWGGFATNKHAYMGDAINGARHRKTTGIPDKNLLMMPHRLALALQADGWWVVNVFVTEAHGDDWRDVIHEGTPQEALRHLEALYGDVEWPPEFRQFR